MQVNIVFDAQAQAAPQAFRGAIQAAGNVLSATFENSITINIEVGYGDYPKTGTPEPSGVASAFPSGGAYDGYSQVRSWLKSNAAAVVQSGIDALPLASAIQGQSQVAVWRAQEKLMGQVSSNDTGLDGYAGFAADIPSSSLEGVALHELTHAMGRLDFGPQPDIMDLYRFSSQGVRLLTSGVPNASSYFSLDGGKTDLADYGQTSDPSDFLNIGGRSPNDPFNEFYASNNIQGLTPIDLLEMEGLGYRTLSQGPQQAHGNDPIYSGTATGGNHFIDFINFEASYVDLISAFGLNQTAMRNWYQVAEPGEQRVGTFDGADYVASYGDLISAFGPGQSLQGVQDAGASHFISNGLAEGRSTTFNGMDYIASYRDLIGAFGANSDVGAYHFIEFGNREGRGTTFDGLYYIASQRDLIRAFGANEQAGAGHFVAFGDREGRVTTFNGLAYIAKNPDLMFAFGANNDAGASHYITTGINEGRDTAFNVSAYEAAHPDLLGTYADDTRFLTAYIDTYVTTWHPLT